MIQLEVEKTEPLAIETSIDPRRVTIERTRTQTLMGNIVKFADLFSERIALKIMYRLFFRVQRVNSTEKHQKFYSMGIQFKFTFEDKQIAVYEFGKSGKNVLVLHGWDSIAYHMKEIIQGLVESQFRVVAIDLPGHGDSEGKTTNGIEVVRLISRLNEKYDFIGVVGHSFGGACAIMSSVQLLGERKVVAISSPLNFLTVLETFSATLNLRENLMKRYLSYLNEKFAADLEDWDVSRKNLEGGNSYMVIHDDDDVLVPFKIELANSIENVRILRTKGLGHAMIVRDKGVITSVVDFMSGR